MCPELGPLDYINSDGDIEWNHGSPQNYDGMYNKTASEWTDKVDNALIIGGFEPDEDLNDDVSDDTTVSQTEPWKTKKNGGINKPSSDDATDTPLAKDGGSETSIGGDENDDAEAGSDGTSTGGASTASSKKSDSGSETSVGVDENDNADVTKSSSAKAGGSGISIDNPDAISEKEGEGSLDEGDKTD